MSEENLGSWGASGISGSPSDGSHVNVRACLDGDAEGALDGAGRLGQDGKVSGAAAPADSAATAMEQRQLDVVPVCHRHQLLLRSNIPPTTTQALLVIM